jgi:hypothetical protein
MCPLRRARLPLERLGPRDCPSRTVSLVNGTLTVSGAPAGPPAFRFAPGVGPGFRCRRR